MAKNFRDLSLTVAVDTSGSTHGRTLEAEKFVIRQLLELSNLQPGKHVKVLPWSDSSEGLLRLDKGNQHILHALTSGGGTNPSVLYESAESVDTLRSSDLWFLLTDGEIEDDLTQDFAVRTAGLELHNISCVVIVFGSFLEGRPASCNISVGISTYSLAPDCLFLFHDVATSTLSILQAKGCFKQFLTRKGTIYVQPHINEYTSWAELPRMTYEDLMRIEITARPTIGSDDMILHNNKVLNLQELYSGSADEEVVEALLRNQDNMKSLVMAELARGHGKQLDAWLETQHQPLTQLSADRIDVNEAAQSAIRQLLDIWQVPDRTEERGVLQEQLRTAHKKNRQVLRESILSYERTRESTSRRSSNVASARRQSMSYSDFRSGHPGVNSMTAASEPIGLRARKPRRSSLGIELSAGWNEADEASDQGQHDHARHRTRTVFSHTSQRTVPLHSLRNDATKSAAVVKDCFLPSYKLETLEVSSQFRGTCELCQAESLLALLLKTESQDIKTENFPRRGSSTPLTFPLAMSEFKETDVLASFICCDACAYHLVRNLITPNNEAISAALPLADLATNKDAWLDTLDNVYKGRFQREDIFQVFISTLDRKLQNNNVIDEDKATTAQETTFHDALQWCIMELSECAPAVPTLSAAFRGKGVRRKKGRTPSMSKRTLSMLLKDETFIDPSLPNNQEIAMLRYPVAGFAVIIRLLQIRKLHKKKIAQYIRLRLLFELTETLYKRFETSTPAAEKALIQSILSQQGTNVIDFGDTSIRATVTTGSEISTLLQTPVVLLLEHALLSEHSFVELCNLRTQIYSDLSVSRSSSCDSASTITPDPISTSSASTSQTSKTLVNPSQSPNGNTSLTETWKEPCISLFLCAVCDFAGSGAEITGNAVKCFNALKVKDELKDVVGIAAG